LLRATRRYPSKLKLCRLTSHGSLYSLVLAAALIAASPSVADLDAHSRASGNRPDLAVTIGEHIFGTTWPAQVVQVLANETGPSLVLGLRLSGVKFHSTLTREAFDGEVKTLIARAFAAAPQAQEVDLWVTVPIVVGKDVVVSGDLAKPTTKTVFTISVMRNESAASIDARLRGGSNIFLDKEWAASAFAKS
jgi:hypothetical protein